MSVCSGWVLCLQGMAEEPQGKGDTAAEVKLWQGLLCSVK